VFSITTAERSANLQDAAVRVFTDEFQKNADDPRTHHKIKLMVPHARELMEKAEDLPVVELMTWVARYEYVRAAYKSAEELWRRECEIRRRILGKEHTSTLTTMVNLAETLRE